jgi:hypothetical protein
MIKPNRRTSLKQSHKRPKTKKRQIVSRTERHIQRKRQIINDVFAGMDKLKAIKAEIHELRNHLERNLRAWASNAPSEKWRNYYLQLIKKTKAQIKALEEEQKRLEKASKPQEIIRKLRQIGVTRIRKRTKQEAEKGYSRQKEKLKKYLMTSFD